MRKEFAGLIINPSCENRCVFCVEHPEATPEELKEQEIKIFRSIVDWKNRGFDKIEISGSDPIEYSKLPSLVRYLKRTGFKFIQVSSHGNHLEDKNLAEELARSGVNKFRIPVYGPSPGIHDSVTGKRGSFQRAIKGIKNIKKYHPDIDIQISSLVTQQNKDHLADMINLISRMGIKDIYISIPCIKDPARIKDYYIPIKDLPPYAKKAHIHSQNKNIPVHFMEIPFCVFGVEDGSIINTSKPPDHSACQPMKSLRTKEKDLPDYRVKTKPSLCSGCRMSSRCDGFFKNDISVFGTGKLKKL